MYTTKYLVAEVSPKNKKIEKRYLCLLQYQYLSTNFASSRLRLSYYTC